MEDAAYTPKNCHECGNLTRPKLRGPGYTKFCDTCSKKLKGEGRFEDTPKRKTVKDIDSELQEIKERLEQVEKRIG